jgi:hypothetical protein
MWKRFQKVLPSHPGRNGGGLMSTGASQSPPRIVPESSESARDVIALHPARSGCRLTRHVRSGAPQGRNVAVCGYRHRIRKSVVQGGRVRGSQLAINDRESPASGAARRSRTPPNEWLGFLYMWVARRNSVQASLREDDL